MPQAASEEERTRVLALVGTSDRLQVQEAQLTERLAVVESALATVRQEAVFTLICSMHLSRFEAQTSAVTSCANLQLS